MNKAVTALALGVVALLVASGANDALAAPDESTIGSLTMDVGESGTTQIDANVLGPGVGAWTLDVGYDSTVVELIDCVGLQRTVCGKAFDPETVRITGASADNLTYDVTLAQFAFECRSPGVSELSMHVEVWSIAHSGLDDLDAPVVTEGSITCVEPSEEETRTSTPQIVLPDTGSGSTADAHTWPVVAALAALGATLLAAAGLPGLRRSM